MANIPYQLDNLRRVIFNAGKVHKITLIPVICILYSSPCENKTYTILIYTLFNTESIGYMTMFRMPNNSRRMVLALVRNPAESEIVWVKDSQGRLWRALTTTLDGIFDYDAVTEKLQTFMETD